MVDILSGKLVSKAIEIELIDKVKKIKEQNFIPKLCIIQIGDDYASKIYVNMKKKACEKVGIDCTLYNISEDITQKEVLSLIKKLNKDVTVSGIMVQHPIPDHLNEMEIVNTILPSKDVDGLTDINLSKIYLNEKGFIPATALGIIKLLEFFDIDFEGKNAIVIGRSRIVGKPLASLLTNLNATVTIAHSKTKDLNNIIKNYDMVFVAVGKPHFIKSSLIKKDAIVVDAGYNEGNIGDVSFDKVKHLKAYTPVPGGVGPMTIMTLIYQTVEACIIQNNITLNN